MGYPEARFIFTGHYRTVQSVAFSKDAAVLASGGDDATVRIWDLGSRRQIRILKGHSKRVAEVAFGPDANAPASGDEDSNIILWDVGRGRAAKRWKNSNGAVLSLCFSPAGPELVSTGNCSLRIWDTIRRRMIRTLLYGPEDVWWERIYAATRDFPEPVLVSKYSPDGKALACGCTNRTLLVWDTRTWKGRVLKPAKR